MFSAVFEEDSPEIRKRLDEWHAALYKEHKPMTGFDELPEDHPDYDAVQKIRQELVARGIDPATVYPVSADFTDRQDLNEPVTLTVSFAYKQEQPGG